MMVKSFFNEEIKSLVVDVDNLEEWKKKCEELGLNSQLSLAEEDKSPVPYPLLKTIEKRVYETLCPRKQDYKDFNQEPIPLEALRDISLAEKEGYFEDIQIWSDTDSPDPIAIGIRSRQESTYEKDWYRIVTWGQEKILTFATLKKLAIERWTKEKTVKLKDKISDGENELKNIKNSANKWFTDGNAWREFESNIF